jgi:PAS domain S-box-containing protein
MRRKTQIVLAIAFMVAALVTVYSYIFISQLLRQRLEEVDNTASNLSSQLAYLATNAVPDLSSTRVDTNNPEAVRRAIVYYLSTDRNLNTMMQSVLSSWPMIYETSIVDSKGRAILDTDPSRTGQEVPQRPDFEVLRSARVRQQFRMIYSPARTYDVVVSLQLNGQPFGTIHVGISTVFIRNEITLRLQHAIAFSAIAILFSLIFAAGLSHIALGPLERINRTLDSVAGKVEAPAESRDEYGMVSLKIASLGQQMRDAKEIFSALKDNVDQIMGNLQDGLVLFTRDGRIVLVSASVERFLGRPRKELLGRMAKEVFSRNSPLGVLVLEAFRLKSQLVPQETESPNGKRIELSLDFIQEKGTPIGALMILRDAESVRRIEDEIELSRRMSASGRLTRGVAHEVKNPINAIVLHLQLLQNKLQQIDPDTRRHMEIIDSEIHRLDRVVQILVDFTRPRDLHLEDTDLRHVLEDVALLATPDAEQHGVSITQNLASEPLPVKVDVDFVKQAILNVVLNGIQAMPNGGKLSLSARKQDEFVLTEIRDEGGGIPPELQEKIFELYFTTKSSGTGIGLAQTYQILQWHYGSVDFESIQGQGTTFRLHIPLAELHTENLREEATKV